MKYTLEELCESNLKLADAINVGNAFSERDTLKEAYDYAQKVIKAMHPEDRLPAYTMLHVMLNTLSKRIKEINEV